VELKGGLQADSAGEQVDIGIGARRRVSGLATLELNRVELMARLTRRSWKKKEEKKGELGSGKPYDEQGEVEATLAIPALSRRRRRDEGEEEERIRTGARKRAGSKS
jgi:hypothetical protein